MRRNCIMNIPENVFSKLTEEQKKKVEAAQSPEELLALAKETGYELTQEQLEGVAGGTIWCRFVCDTEEQCPVQWEH